VQSVINPFTTQTSSKQVEQTGLLDQRNIAEDLANNNNKKQQPHKEEQEATVSAAKQENASPIK